MNHVAAAQGVDEQVIGGLGQIRQTALGPDQSGRTDREVAAGLEEVADLAVGNAERFGPGPKGANCIQDKRCKERRWCDPLARAWAWAGSRRDAPWGGQTSCGVS
jgi:hypothetical protein